MFSRRRIATFALCLLVLLLAVAVLRPGPHRAFAPGLYGLTQVSPGVWTDMPDQAPILSDLMVDAQAQIHPFWGDAIIPNRLIACFSSECAEKMGLWSHGLTLGAHVILLAPKGLTQEILAHELSHIALHRHLTLKDLVSPRFPAWFDEGLATYLSPDSRYEIPTDAEAAAWIRAAHTPREWRRLVNQDTWPQAYGAASYQVEQLSDQIGQDGLHVLIQNVADGTDFYAALAQLGVTSLDP